MKTILFLTNQLPYPPVSGAPIKSWGVLKHLAQRHKIILGSFLKGKDSAYGVQMQTHVTLQECCLKPIDAPWTLRNLILSYREGVPLNVFLTQSNSFRAWVEKKVPGCDLIFVDHYEMFQYVPKEFSGRVILHQHNVEHVIFRQMAELSKGPRKWMISLESKRIAKYEKNICLIADRILAAPNDQRSMAELGVPQERFALTYHLGEDYLIEQPDLRYQDSKPILLCIGTLSSKANSDGLDWFLKKVWPLIREKSPELRFRVVGRGANPELVALCEQSDGVEMGGFVKDLEPEYCQARVFVCPLRFGSGTKVKVINALSRGLPVATTPIGAEGLPAPESFMEVQDQPESLAESILNLTLDPALWMRQAKAGREAARSELSWGRVFAEIDNVIDEG